MGSETIDAEPVTAGPDAGWALLPAEVPLVMPDQALGEGAL